MSGCPRDAVQIRNIEEISKLAEVHTDICPYLADYQELPRKGSSGEAAARRGDYALKLKSGNAFPENDPTTSWSTRPGRKARLARKACPLYSARSTTPGRKPTFRTPLWRNW